MSLKENTLYFRQRVDELKEVKPVRVGSLFFLTGVILFHFVWWPIQAERALSKLRMANEKLADKKSELNDLENRYHSMTTLAALDQWSKRHGPWMIPKQNDIVSISN